MKTLNENQRTAVGWDDGPLLVLAGPGSGKTTVLTQRVARLIEADEHASVLALTFTNKAAAEMRERVDALLGGRTDRARLCTFHAFAADLLRQHGSHVGLRPDFSLLVQDEDRIAVLEEAIAQLPEEPEEEESPPADRKNLVHLIDRLFAKSYDGGRQAPFLLDTPAWLPRLYRGYCDSLVAANRLDYGSLLHFARRLLVEQPGVARVLRLVWSHVCIDEFEDTNNAQYELLRLIAPAPRNLFVVADDDQIIYQWNGASPERLRRLRREYQPKIVQLPECYRCPQPIVDLANRLIAHNMERDSGKKPISAQSGAAQRSDVVRCKVFESPEQETAFVAQDMAERELLAAECVVIGRTVKLIERAAAALRSAGYDVHLSQRTREFESPAAGTILHALRLANARHDRTILRRLCLAWEALSGTALEPETVAAAAALVGGDFLRSWADAAAAVADQRAAGALRVIRSELVDSLAFPAVVEAFLDQGWKEWCSNGDGAVAKEEVDTWRTLHHEITGEHGSGITLHDYLPQLDLASKEPRPGKDAVRCMTVHRAKGLEFKHVYLIGLAQEVLPSFQALRRGMFSSAVEEERRNCFVAVTRASDTLTLTRARKYYGYRKPPSQFLTEMGLVAPAGPGGNRDRREEAPQAVLDG